MLMPRISRVDVSSARLNQRQLLLQWCDHQKSDDLRCQEFRPRAAAGWGLIERGMRDRTRAELQPDMQKRSPPDFIRWVDVKIMIPFGEL